MKKKSSYTYLKGSCDLSVCKAVQSQVCVFGDCVGMVNSIHSLWHEDGLLLEIVKTMNSDDSTAKKIVDLIKSYLIKFLIWRNPWKIKRQPYIDTPKNRWEAIFQVKLSLARNNNYFALAKGAQRYQLSVLFKIFPLSSLKYTFSWK